MTMATLILLAITGSMVVLKLALMAYVVVLMTKVLTTTKQNRQLRLALSNQSRSDMAHH